MTFKYSNVVQKFELVPVVEVLLVDLAQLLHPLPQRRRGVLQVRHGRQPTLQVWVKDMIYYNKGKPIVFRSC